MEMEQQLKSAMAGLLAAGLLMVTTMVHANERESLEQLRTTTLSLIELLVEEGVLSKSKADQLIKQAEASRQAALAKEADAAPQSSGEGEEKVVRVQYVPEHVKNELREEIKQEVMAKAQSEGWAYPGSIPEWLNRIEWTGDLRLRYELDSFPQGNTLPFRLQGSELRNVNISNTTEDRNRLRVRARLGANIKANDWLTGGIRMTTGSTTDPLSPNQTLENTNGKFSFALDRAFLKAQFYPWLSISGGRIANPWFHTDLVWDPDLAFDGVAVAFTPRFSDAWSAFGTIGAFPVESIQTSDTNKVKDKWLFGGQAGIEWKSSQTTAKLGVALYDYEHVEGTPNPVGDSTAYAASAPVFRQKGNNTFSIDYLNGGQCGTNNGLCGLASKFRELDLTGQVDLAAFNPIHVILTGDYVRNIGFDKNEILTRTGNLYQKEDKGYQVKLVVGMPEVTKRYDWQVFGSYKRLEADAVLDGFTDSDFHLGGTDTKGWTLGASYGVDKNTWLTARWFSADEISGPPLAIDVLMFDLNAKF